MPDRDRHVERYTSGVWTKIGAILVIAENLRALLAGFEGVALERVSVIVSLEPGGFVADVTLDGEPWPEGVAFVRRLLSALGLPVVPP